MMKKIFVAVLFLTGSTLASAQITQEFLDSLQEMSTPDLAARAENAQVKAFDMFNELNDDDFYDVLCERIRDTGTRLSVIRCEPRFVGELELLFKSSVDGIGGGLNDDGQGILVGDERLGSESGAMNDANEELANRINSLREENPEFHELFTEYQAYTVVLSKR